jgi:hypothetical protein
MTLGLLICRKMKQILGMVVVHLQALACQGLRLGHWIH